MPKLATLIQLISSGKIDELTVILPENQSYGDLSKESFLNILDKEMQFSTFEDDVQIISVKVQSLDYLPFFHSVKQYFEAAELIETLGINFTNNPFMQIDKEVIFKNDGYFDSEYLPNQLLGIPKVKSDTFLETYSFYNEFRFYVSLSFEMKKGSDEVIDIWFCKRIKSESFDMEYYAYFGPKEIKKDLYQNYIKSNEYFMLEGEIQLVKNIIEKQFNNIVCQNTFIL